MSSLELPRYTRWDQVPDGLYTKTQLGRLTPPRKPTGLPVARVLYHGNRYASLYPLADTRPKLQTPAQRAAALRNLDLRYVCKHCGRQVDWPLGRGRRCRVCRLVADARAGQQQGQRQAAALLADPDRVLLHTTTTPDTEYPTRVVVVRVADGTVLLDLPADPTAPADQPTGYPVVLARLDALMTSLPAVTRTETRTGVVTTSRVLTWDGSGHVPVLRLRNPAAVDHRELWAGAEAYPWLPVLGSGSVLHAFHSWWAEPCCPWDTFDGYEDLPGRLPARWWVPLPGATGDAAADARLMTHLLRLVAEGTAPVSPRALFHHPPRPRGGAG